MLSYDEDSGILWIHPMFGAEVNKERIEKHSIIATIDDCECLARTLGNALISYSNDISTIQGELKNER